MECKTIFEPFRIKRVEAKTETGSAERERFEPFLFTQLSPVLCHFITD